MMSEYLYKFAYQLLTGFFKISIFGFLPIIFVFFIFICTITIAIKYKKVSLIQELKPLKKNYKSQNIFYGIDKSSFTFLTVCMIISCVPVFVYLNIKFENYTIGMLDKIEVLGTITIGLTTMVVTAAVVNILFNKNYYLVFSAQEVLNCYHFFNYLAAALISCIITCIFTMSLLDQEIKSYFEILRFITLEMAVVCNIICSSMALWIIFHIMFSDEKRELKMLSELYRIFRLPNVDETRIKNADDWTYNAIKINVEYLADRYVTSCKKININQVTKLEFVTTIGKYKEKWFKKTRTKYICILLELYLFSVIISKFILKDECTSLLIINTIFCLIGLLLSFFKINCFQIAVIKLFSDTWGYYLKKEKELFIPRVALRPNNKFDKYIINLNSLIAFFYIALLNNVDMKKIEDALKIVIEWFDEIDKKSAIVYLPIFTIGYFAFEREIQMDNIKSVYNKLDFFETGKQDFIAMIHSQIFHLKRNKTLLEFENKSSVNSYLKWLSIK